MGTTEVIKHTYQLKRGYEDAVNRANPLLAAGEPIVVFCNDGKTRMKIGDGKQLYNKLEFIGGVEKSEVLTFDSHFDFPYPPEKENYNAIYKASNEAKLWHWNTDKFKYEPLDNVDVEVTLGDVEYIVGGTALDFIGSV